MSDAWELRKMFFWLIAGMIISALVFALALFILDFKEKLVSTPPELRAEVISLRFTNIPECFAYQDRTGRVYPGIIDLAKFNQQQLDGCYSVDAERGYRDINFKLSLSSFDKEIATRQYYNISHFKQERKVQVFYEGTMHPDVLTIHTQADLPSPPRFVK